MSPRAQLKTGLWVDALIRRAQVGGAFACVMTRGDRDAGSVIIIVRAQDGVKLYTPERDMDGARVWRAQAMEDAALGQAIKSRLNFDSDMTVVEVEDRDGRHFIEEPVLGEGPRAMSAAQAAAEAAAKALFRGQ